MYLFSRSARFLDCRPTPLVTLLPFHDDLAAQLQPLITPCFRGVFWTHHSGGREESECPSAK
eukprot:88218-Pelagomonas_calceolata.AAC.1